MIDPDREAETERLVAEKFSEAHRQALMRAKEGTYERGDAELLAEVFDYFMRRKLH